MRTVCHSLLPLADSGLFLFLLSFLPVENTCFLAFFLCAMVAERSLHTKGYGRKVKPSQLLPPAHDWGEVAEHKELTVGHARRKALCQ